MLLHSLLHQLDSELLCSAIPDVEVRAVVEDSRQVKPGDLFIARAGTKADGRSYIADARSRGAIAVVIDQHRPGCPLPQIVVSDAATAGSRLAHLLAGDPSRQLRVMGVTGTNGKTTTAYLVRHILARVGIRCGMIGTVQVDDGCSAVEAAMTTPPAGPVAQLLTAMRDNSCDACAMEVSSHGLDQGRVAGVHFAAAAFTNLTGDHLDYHKEMAPYAAAKARLFELLEAPAAAIVNAEDPWSARMLDQCRAGRQLRWGFTEDAQYRATDIVITADTSRFTLHTPLGQSAVTMRLLGQHNIANALTATALVGETFAVSPAQIAAALADAAGAPGRLQEIRLGQPFTVLVDYAHTDDALKNVLTAMRAITRGRLRVLFGCGGERDQSKRPRMASVAEELADFICVTSDNPRSERPEAIIDEILTGFSPGLRVGRCAGKELLVEPDRRAAIEKVIAEAQPGDVVLLAGKGHENYQIVGGQKRHFDDVEAATAAIEKKGHGRPTRKP